MTDRERIAARLQALRDKTVENGCTEAEALAAAEMLANLLAKYNMTLDEAELRASPFANEQSAFEGDVGERLWKPAAGISVLTGATYWISKPGVHPVRVSFFGFQHEVEVANYMLAICDRAMRQEEARLARDAMLLVPAARRRRILPHLDGMADRLRERIAAMKPPPPTGKGLVVLRGALITEAMAAAGIELEDRRANRSRDFEASYGDGRRAADRVGLNQAMAGGRQARGLLR